MGREEQSQENYLSASFLLCGEQSPDGLIGVLEDLAPVKDRNTVLKFSRFK